MVQVLGSGLAMGCVYALVALGFILVYNATGGLNFAQGELVMVAAYVAATFLGSARFPRVAAALGVVAVMALVGLVYQRVVYYPLRHRSFLAFIIATIGAGIFLRNLVLIVWGPDPRRVSSFFRQEFVSVGGAKLTPENLFILGVTFVVLAGQWALFFHTDLGRRLRASAQNPEMAQLMGISLSRMIALTFMLSTLLAGIAGVLVAPIFLVDVDLGLNVILKSFIAVIIGGFGSLPGAVVGGLVIGVLEILLAVFVSSTYKDALAFTILILFLFLFPRGIFGEAIAERA